MQLQFCSQFVLIEEKTYVKKKIVKFVDCLARRFWPVNWTSLQPLLFQTETPEQVEMNLLCLGSLHMTVAGKAKTFSPHQKNSEIFFSILRFQAWIESSTGERNERGSRQLSK